ncbi:MAG: SUMF1/EgtB/PvdO family nonheme iron enzyme [Chloroflexi bacterium]|nr:SUMF1/EgtB/PvdO family nonheme iron enzyme [Chloroflexota bacterium]
MVIDFTEIESGEEFELLCEDLLRAMGFAIEHPPARGPEGGKDLIIGEVVRDKMGFAEERKTLVQCKHKAQSGRAVGFAEVANYRDAMDQYKVRRYLLITSTLPTEDLRTKFEATSKKGDYVALTWAKNYLARLLDEHSAVRDRYFPPEEVETPTPAGSLSETVEGLLTVMGFACQSREAIADRVRLVCTRKGAFARPVAVVCREGAIERPDVEALLAQVQAQELGGGVLVTHTRVSPAARQRAATTEGAVRAFTLAGFYRELIDFEPYVRGLVDDYETDELSTYYVDLGCRSGDGSIYKPLDDYADAWLDDPARNHISILGDYGTGKTSFCRQYAAKLGRRWLADPDRARIPILISLRDYAKAMNLEQLVTDFLVNRYDIPAKYKAFNRFNRDGKLVLLFDGFDEMAQKVDYQTTVDNFEELARAVEAKSKVILTCRTPYFRTGREAELLLSCRGPEAVRDALDLPERTVIDLSDRPNFEIVHLLPFDQKDIQTMLRARLPDEWERYWQQIEHTYNLEELAQRPVLLDMIARSLPDLEPGQAINAARLYQVYTDLWLRRDEDKGRTLITRSDKRLFMQELSLEMVRRQELALHYSELPERVRAYFRLEKAAEIDYFEHDIRTCSFLNRDGEGNYKFVHKSFQEFFVAQWLAPKLLDGSAPEMTINEEIRGFVHGLLAEVDWPSQPPQGVEAPEGMVWVPPGPFIYGAGESTRVLRLEQGFFVARTPVTNSEYARFVAATGHEPPRHWKGKTPPDELRDHPVVYVEWDDATAYAEWAGVRLPSEQEWEKAARGIDGRVYPWGDEFDPNYCNTEESGVGTTTTVGRYSPGGDSPGGCVDMAGNVWEWTASESSPDSGIYVSRGVLERSGCRALRVLQVAPALLGIQLRVSLRLPRLSFVLITGFWFLDSVTF